MGSWIDNTTVKNQVAYFESINRPLIAQAEAADARKSLSGAMLALYRMSEASPADGEEQARARRQFQKNLKPSFLPSPPWKGGRFLSRRPNPLPAAPPSSLGNWPFSKPIWNASPLLPEENSNSAILPDSGALHVIRNQAEVLDNLTALPLDMKQFQTAQENFVEKAVRSSFFIPIICFAVVLIYGFFFRNTHLKKEEEEKPAQA